jgi:hypothetical protein
MQERRMFFTVENLETQHHSSLAALSLNLVRF